MSHQESDRSCEQYRELALAAIDGEIAAADKSDLERHTASCEACRRFAADVRAIRDVTSRLPRMAPRADGWNAISARLKQEPRVVPLRAPISRRVLVAVAAVLIVVVGATLLVLRRPGALGGQAGATGPGTAGSAAGSAVNAQQGDLVRTVDEELRLATEHYDKAIAGLEQISKTGQSALDPKVAETLQANLGIIDKAIGDSRLALKSQPASQPAQESLFESLRRKVALLEDTIALINEMRKGNQAGAAKVIKGLNKT